MAAQSPYYYFILLAVLLMTVGFVSVYYKALETHDTSNFSNLSLGSFFMAMIIFLVIAIQRYYPIHIIFYLVSLVAIAGMIHLKQKENSTDDDDDSTDDS